jgi:hypothetical protein
MLAWSVFFVFFTRGREKFIIVYVVSSKISKKFSFQNITAERVPQHMDVAIFLKVGKKQGANQAFI